MSCFFRWSAPLAVLCLLASHAQGQEVAAPQRSIKSADANAQAAYRPSPYFQTTPQLGSPVPLSSPDSRVRVLINDDGVLIFFSQKEWLEKIEKSGKLPDGFILIESNMLILEPTGTKEYPYEWVCSGQATIQTNQFMGIAERISIYEDMVSMTGKNQGVTLHKVNPQGQDMTLKAESIQLNLTTDSIQVEWGTTIDANGAKPVAPQPNLSNPFSTSKYRKKPTEE